MFTCIFTLVVICILSTIFVSKLNFSSPTISDKEDAFADDFFWSAYDMPDDEDFVDVNRTVNIGRAKKESKSEFARNMDWLFSEEQFLATFAIKR